ncbi:MAG: N-acetylmuramoyl-L-alanine amidase [Elusimicrobia bacterium]|nr:MAG: N-acetylmuramoyl-L-alanine amidase [Elusimicrobiota bacterium]
MTRKTPWAVLSLAAAIGCSKCDPAAPEAAASHNAEFSASAEGPVLTPPPPGVQVAAYAPASESSDGRVFFDGDRLRDGLNGGGGVRGQYSDNSNKWASLRGQLATSRQGRATYNAVPAPRGTSGNGLRPDASARFEQAMYTTVYPVLTRMGWGARQRRGGASGMDPYRLTVHHTMGHQTVGEAETAAAVRGIQGFHQGPERGWADIGYHFLIDGEGRVAEGRPANVLGAHAAEANQGNLGISLMGNFNVQQPTDPQMDSLERLAAYLALRYDIPVMKSGYLEGHNHHGETSCPGTHLNARLAEVRSRVMQEEAKIRDRDASDGKATYAAFTPMVVSRPG